MEFFAVGLAALLSSALTFFSGFGLGTILMPVFALFFPLELAIALTAIVHLLNNLFKLGLLATHVNPRVLLRFGLPAVLAAFVGAEALVWLADLPAVGHYELAGRTMEISPLKLILAALIVVFAVLEMLPRYGQLALPERCLPLGGVLSGFFGGLSGHQGALRSAFLVRSGLSKESFIATGVAIACLVDAARLAIYGTAHPWDLVRRNVPMLTVAVLAAFAGALAGRRLLHKVTYRAVQNIVAAMLLLIAAGMAAGLI